MGGGTVDVVSSKGCSRLLFGFSSPLSSLGGLQQLDSMSLASSSSRSESVKASLIGPFTGLVICVTGLSKGWLYAVNLFFNVLILCDHHCSCVFGVYL